MRKLAAILLILVLFFNLFGYRIVIALAQNNADEQLALSLDNNQYDESQLIEIRVALNMPYQERFTEFERHYGEIEIDGKSYTYVKRKVEGDILVLKCIANESKQQLKSMTHALAKANSAADMDHSGKSKQPSFAKNLWSEYDDQLMSHSMYNQSSNSVSFFTYSFLIPEVSINTPHQPPDALRFLS